MVMPKPRTAPIRLQVSVSEELAEAVKDFRFGQRFNSESSALNALITLGLEAHKHALRLAAGQTGGAGWKPKSARTPR